MKIAPAQGFKLRGNLNQISLSMSGYFHFVRKTLSLLLISSAAFFTPDIFGGGVIFSSSTPKDFANSKFVRLRKDGTLLLRRPDLRGLKKIRVSPKKSYRVSCDILPLNGAVAEVRIGIIPFIKKVPANVAGILPVKGTVLLPTGNTSRAPARVMKRTLSGCAVCWKASRIRMRRTMSIL